MVAHRGGALLDTVPDVSLRRCARDMVGGLQPDCSIAHVLDGAHQRIIVAQATGAAPPRAARQVQASLRMSCRNASSVRSCRAGSGVAP